MRSPVTQVLNGKSVAQYNSLSTAHRLTGVDSSNIAKVTGGRRNTAGGYSWEGAESVNSRRKIVVLDPTSGETVAIFNSVAAIRDASTVRMDRVVEALVGIRRTAVGLVWTFTA